jgi:hypothetical protein
VVTLSGQPVLIATALDRNVYAFSSTGDRLWTAKVPGPAYTLAALETERFAVGDDAGYVTLLDSAGQTVWQVKVGSRVTSVAPGLDGLLAGGWDEQLVALTADGRVRWRADLDGPVSGLVALDDLAVAATASGSLWAFDAAGVQVWRLDAGAPLVQIGRLDAGMRDLILAGSQDGRLLALDGTGTLHWQHLLGPGAPVWHSADWVAGPDPEIVVGFGGDAPSLALLSVAGEMLWRVSIPFPVMAIDSLDLDGDGTLEILTGLADGQIRVLDGQGLQRSSIHVGLPVWHLVVEGPQSAFVLADVIVRRIVAGPGAAGKAWFPPPATVTVPPRNLPRGSEVPDGAMTLLFLGDVTLGRSVERQLERYGPSYPWQHLRPLLDDAGLVAVNLRECCRLRDNLWTKVT